MFGLNLGASLVPWATALAWAAAGDPKALMVTALLSALLPVPLLEGLHHWQQGRREQQLEHEQQHSGRDAGKRIEGRGGAFSSIGSSCDDGEETKDNDADGDRPAIVIELTDGFALSRAFTSAGGSCGSGTKGQQQQQQQQQLRKHHPYDVAAQGTSEHHEATTHRDHNGNDEESSARSRRHGRSKAAAAAVLVLAVTAAAAALTAAVRGNDLADDDDRSGHNEHPSGDDKDYDDDWRSNDDDDDDAVVVPALGMVAEFDYTLALGPIGLDYPWVQYHSANISNTRTRTHYGSHNIGA